MNKKIRMFIYALAFSVMLVGCVTDKPAVDPSDEPSDEVSVTTKNIRVGSFNIKYGANAGYDLGKIAELITELDLDIVGVQEVDYKTVRSGGVDQAAEIAAAAGMEYYKFCRCIDYNGGEYGTLILSKYPIQRSKIYPLESGGREARALAYANIDVDGNRIYFFNTHLSYESAELRAEQLAQIKEIMSEGDSFILTGDMNTSDFTEFDVLGGTLVSRPDRPFATFPKYNTPIDNIVFSDRYTEVSAGVRETTCSDHYLLWAELSFVVE